MAEAFYTGYLDSVPNRLDSLKYDIVGIYAGLWTEEEIDDIAGRLEAIEPNNTPEENEKQYLDHLIYIYQGGNIDNRWGELWTMARQCVFYGGPAVLEARALLIMDSIQLRYYPWTDSCIAPSSKRAFEPETEQPEKKPAITADYRLKPNYYLGDYSAEVSLGSEEAGYLVIYDMAGRVLGEHILDSGKNNLYLNELSGSSGIFIYKIYVDGAIKRVDKLLCVE